MADGATKALGILKRAMQLEQEGRRFYLKAAGATPEETGRQTFISLADDEQKHLRLIRRQYQALARGNKWVSLAEIKPAPIALDKPLFPRDKEAWVRTVAGKSSELDALLFGLDIENRSFDLYRGAAAQTADPLGKNIFEFLAGEERGHFDILMMRYEFLAGPVGWRY